MKLINTYCYYTIFIVRYFCSTYGIIKWSLEKYISSYRDNWRQAGANVMICEKGFVANDPLPIKFALYIRSERRKVSEVIATT